MQIRSLFLGLLGAGLQIISPSILLLPIFLIGVLGDSGKIGGGPIVFANLCIYWLAIIGSGWIVHRELTRWAKPLWYGISIHVVSVALFYCGLYSQVPVSWEEGKLPLFLAWVIPALCVAALWLCYQWVSAKASDYSLAIQSSVMMVVFVSVIGVFVLRHAPQQPLHGHWQTASPNCPSDIVFYPDGRLRLEYAAKAYVIKRYRLIGNGQLQIVVPYMPPPTWKFSIEGSKLELPDIRNINSIEPCNYYRVDSVLLW